MSLSSVCTRSPFTREATMRRKQTLWLT